MPNLDGTHLAVWTDPASADAQDRIARFHGR